MIRILLPIATVLISLPAFADEPVRVLPAGPDESVLLYEGMPSPYVPDAGTEGFSDGPTAQRAANAFAGMDRDGDRVLDRSETAPAGSLAEHFVAYDINGDGAIAANEFQSWFAADGQYDQRALAAQDE